jgi:hypothetical protein
VAGVLAVVSLILGVALENPDRQPWRDITSVVFSVSLLGLVVSIVLRSRARRRAVRADALYEEAVDFLAQRHPTWRAEIRALRSEFRSRFVPLPVMAEPARASGRRPRALPSPAAANGAEPSQGTWVDTSWGPPAAPRAADRPDRPTVFDAERIAPVSSAPGWTTDPTGRHELRYWDGTVWTHHVSDRSVASIDPIDEEPG